MHRTEGENHTTNLFRDGPPGTRVEQEWLNAIQEEVCNVIESAGIVLETADTETRIQLFQALVALFATEGTYATNAATPSLLVLRDAAGRAKVVAPSVAGDIALKSTVTADIATHDALAAAHGALIVDTTITAGGGFDGANNVRLARAGKMVTMQCGVLTHISAAGVNSAAARIPVAYRPAIDLEITYQSIFSYSRQLRVNADGSFGVDYRDEYSNVNKADTDTGTTIFVSWLTA